MADLIFETKSGTKLFCDFEKKVYYTSNKKDVYDSLIEDLNNSSVDMMSAVLAKGLLTELKTHTIIER